MKREERLFCVAYVRSLEKERMRLLQISQRITQYLSAGGLFNPEMMEHDKVRDLLIEIRAIIDGNSDTKG